MDVEPQRGRKAFGPRLFGRRSPNNPTEGGAPFRRDAIVNPYRFLQHFCAAASVPQSDGANSI